MNNLKYRALKDDLSNFNFVYGYPVMDEEGNPYITEYESDKGYTHHSCIKGTVGQFTGLQDKNGVDIYNGDILSDWVETDEGKIQSFCQVFWNDPTGSWHLDHSIKQDRTYSTELWLDLNDFKYEVSGNIHENKTLL